eukprot:gene11973-biopygen8119
MSFSPPDLVSAVDVVDRDGLAVIPGRYGIWMYPSTPGRRQPHRSDGIIHHRRPKDGEEHGPPPAGLHVEPPGGGGAAPHGRAAVPPPGGGDPCEGCRVCQALWRPGTGGRGRCSLCWDRRGDVGDRPGPPPPPSRLC